MSIDLEEVGARGHPRRWPGPDGPGRVIVTADGGARELRARNLIVAVGIQPDNPRSSRASTRSSLDEPPGDHDPHAAQAASRSWVVGPTGVELAQVFARYGVPITLVHSHDRLNRARPSAQLRRAPGGADARRRHAPAGRAGDGDRGRRRFRRRPPRSSSTTDPRSRVTRSCSPLVARHRSTGWASRRSASS